MAENDDACEVNIEIANMVIHVHISKVSVTAALILASHVVAHHMPVLDLALVKDLSVHMQETPILKRQVRNWITAMSDSALEVRSASVLLVEPDCELGITHSRRPEVIEMGHFVFIGH